METGNPTPEEDKPETDSTARDISGKTGAEAGDNAAGAPPSGDSPKTTDTLIGKVIDEKYKVLERISHGGMGIVYKAEHLLMDRIVAIKVLHAHLVENEDSLRRFRHEAQIASKLTHPNAIMIYDFGVTRGQPYLVMEFVQGVTLKQVISERKALPLHYICKIMEQAGAALAEAHALGIIHRDLKPDNIMICKKEDGSEWIEVLDFGIAKLNRPDKQDANLTQAGTFFGTPKYASPEQVVGKELDSRSDIYALGIILYESLSGEVPFEAETLMQTLLKHINDMPEPLRQFRPELKIPRAVDDLVMKCLAKDANDRFQNVNELLVELRDALNSASGHHRGKKSTNPMIYVGGVGAAALVALLFLLPRVVPDAFGSLAGVKSQFIGLFSSDESNSKESVETTQAKEDKPVEAEKIALHKEDSNSAKTDPVREQDKSKTNVTPPKSTARLSDYAIAFDYLGDYGAMAKSATTMAQGYLGKSDSPPEISDKLEADLHKDEHHVATEQHAKQLSETDIIETSQKTTDLVATGKTRINSVPAGAEIYLNGELKGVSPLTIELQPQDYLLVLKMNSYQEAESTFTVSAGETQNLFITLNKSAQNQQLKQEIEPQIVQPKIPVEDYDDLVRDGERFYRQKRYKEAIPKLESAVIQKKSMKTLLSLGNCYLRVGRMNDAQKVFQAALKLDPDYAPVRLNLACYYALTNQPDRAMDEIETMIFINPRSRSWVREEPDLASLRKLPRYKTMIGQ